MLHHHLEVQGTRKQTGQRDMNWTAPLLISVKFSTKFFDMMLLWNVDFKQLIAVKVLHVK